MHQLFSAKKKLLVLASIGILASCGGDSSSDDPVDSLSYNIQLVGQEDVELDSANIKVKLYGTDRNVADNQATLISETVLELDRIPSSIDLTWPENAYQLIDEPPVNAKEDATYYLNITIDSDGDGIVCSGDLMRDFDETPFFTMNEMPTESLEFNVTVISDGTVCQEF